MMPIAEMTAPVETTPAEIKPGDIINILVVGQAYRAGEESHMADTTILVTLNTFDGTVTLSSVLRDAYVALPAYKSHGEGQNKFNVCYNLGYNWGGITGAMEYVNLTMLRNFGVQVDYNVEISFESFTRLIDYMGGVELELTEAEADYLNEDDLYVKYDVQPGLQYLDGMAALSYARMRKAAGDADSDIKRTARQQKVIETLFEKVRNLSLKELQGVADTLLPLITTTMTPKDVADLMLKMLPRVKNLSFEKGSIPIQTTYWGELQEPYGSVLLFYPDQNKRLIREFTEGEPNPWK
jgi:LCP family protein required for cell wall assembly